jgi:hypothetical protein
MYADSATVKPHIALGSGIQSWVRESYSWLPFHIPDEIGALQCP